MGRRIVVVSLALGLTVFAALSLVLGLALAARTFDAAVVERHLRIAQKVYLQLLRDACPTSSDWVGAYSRQEIPVEYVSFDPSVHPRFSEDDDVKHVLRRTDSSELKFGSELHLFDDNGCLVLM